MRSTRDQDPDRDQDGLPTLGFVFLASPRLVKYCSNRYLSSSSSLARLVCTSLAVTYEWPAVASNKLFPSLLCPDLALCHTFNSSPRARLTALAAPPAPEITTGVPL